MHCGLSVSGTIKTDIRKGITWGTVKKKKKKKHEEKVSHVGLVVLGSTFFVDCHNPVQSLYHLKAKLRYEIFSFSQVKHLFWIIPFGLLEAAKVNCLPLCT